MTLNQIGKQTMTSKFEIGCHIDGNYMNADEFSLAIISLAETHGYQDKYEKAPEETDDDYSQMISEQSDDCVDYLNEETLETRPPFTKHLTLVPVFVGTSKLLKARLFNSAYLILPEPILHDSGGRRED